MSHRNVSREEQWYYIDENGTIKGPFQATIMRRLWEEFKIIEKSLISHNPVKGFKLLTEYFPRASEAFMEKNDTDKSRATLRDLQDPDLQRWYFVDQRGKVQGPFSSKMMYNWYQQGYFDEGLRLYDRLLPPDQFGWQRLQDYFPDYEVEPPFTLYKSSTLEKKMNRMPRKKNDDERFLFPTYFPKPPTFSNIDKIYPSEHPGTAVPIDTTDVFGNPI